MKKFLTLSIAALLGGAMSLSAKTADELRVYINPGHGSWAPNDRPMNVIKKNAEGEIVVVVPNTSRDEGHEPDTTAFYESNTNLQKGLELLRQLQAMGLKFDPTKNQDNEDPARVGAALDMTNNIVMSHVKCGPFPYMDAQSEYYNRSLTEIAKEVEANNFDMFISIHSNAATEGTTTNYPLFLYRGADDPSTVTDEVDRALMVQSKEMAAAAWPHWIANGQNVWTHYTTSTNLRGDWNFYGSHSESTATGADGYLGALKHHVPGFLVEGYFHTYQPARHRAMNWDADHMEGYAYAMGVADYFGLSKPSTGNIFGQVRDLHEKFSHEYYKPNATSDDAYLAICGATVTLKKGDNVVGTYTTDDWFNGVYVFKDLAPGNYTITVEHPDYKAMEAPVEVTVKAGSTAQPATIQLTNVEWVAPSVVYENYPDVYNVPSEGIAGVYVMEQKYVDEPIAELEGKVVRRSLLYNNNLYILALDSDNAATLLVYDPIAKEVKATVSTAGMDGTELNCSDIQMTSDGYLLACNKETTQYNDSQMIASDLRRGVFRVYKWENDENGLPTGDPVCWLTSQGTGNWYRSYAGDTFAYSGTSDEGKLVFSTETTGTTRNLRTMVISVVGGEGAGENFHQPYYQGSANGFTVASMGDDYRFVTSPLNPDNYFVMGSGSLPTLECEFAHTNKTDPISVANDVIDATTCSYSLFKYAGASLMVSPETTADGIAGVMLTNVSDGIANAKAMTVTNGSIEAATAGSQYAMGQTVAKIDASTLEVKGGYMDLFLLRDNKLTYYTTNNVEQPVKRANFAYNLAMTQTDGNYTLTFKSTGAAPRGRVILTNVEDADDQLTFDLGEVRYGDNEYTVDATSFDSKNIYNWAVEINDDPIPASTKFFTQNANFPTVTARGGVVMITDPEQPAFGKIAMSMGFARGIYVFEPDNTATGPYHTDASTMDASNGSSLMRGGERAGKAIFVDWSDFGAGYWEFDPMNPETALRNILAGTKDSGGCYKLGGTPIGGGATSIEFVGSGEDELCYVWCEDYPQANGNYLIRYSSAGKDIIDMAPDQCWNGENGFRNTKSLYANTNVEVNAIPQGLVLNQNRGAGSNSAGCPSLEIYKYDGTRLFNSGAEGYTWITSSGGAALTPDGKIMALPSYGSGINMFRLDWAEDGNSVDVVFLYNIDAPSSGTASEYTQMIFDPAGNLYAYDRAQGLQMFTIKNDNPVATTPAPKTLKIAGAESGVEDVRPEAVDADAPVEYFNLQGIRVANPAKGQVVIRRQGKQATKIVF